LADQEEVFDSPAEWVAKHIHDYVETDGEVGHIWRGYTTLLLTTVGRKSGQLRRTALIYGQEADNYIVVASRGGHSKNPAWYLNLADNPAVDVQVLADKFPAVARTAAGEERERLWALMAALHPAYNTFQAKTKRQIPVVVLERA
jgi:deazaflavin-dependent oxidoreductase (nitroreductase family)